MTTTTENGPPFLPIPGYPTGYPSPKRKLGQAWARAWALMGDQTDGEYLDGVELAQTMADEVGLKRTTMISFLTRAATAGLLERTYRSVPTERGPRNRTHYRIPAGS